MVLAPGDKLGPYEIQSPLGAGGMGELYGARDTRLNRTVAILFASYVWRYLTLPSDPTHSHRVQWQTLPLYRSTNVLCLKSAIPKYSILPVAWANFPVPPRMSEE